MARDKRNERLRQVLAWLVVGVVVVGVAVEVGSIVTNSDEPLSASGDAPSSPSNEAANSVEPSGDEGAAS